MYKTGKKKSNSSQKRVIHHSHPITAFPLLASDIRKQNNGALISNDASFASLPPAGFRVSFGKKRLTVGACKDTIC